MRADLFGRARSPSVWNILQSPLGVIGVRSTSFLETQTILAALEFALRKGGFGNNAKFKKTAQQLIKVMKSNSSVAGRHAQVMDLLRQGATIEEMIKASGSSRRTVFRYLNHFEEAGLKIEIHDGQYTLIDE
jgi:hypothetical protein